MLKSTAENARILFIIDNDFGEMGWALLFVYGQALKSRATFLIPPRLYALNREELPVKTLPYSSYEDISAAIEAERPNVVFLFSGYLLAVHQLVPPPKLEELVRDLRVRGSAIVTSDPFCGLMASNEPLIAAESDVLNAAFSILRDIPHLTPSLVSSTGVQSVSFFNPAFGQMTPEPLPGGLWESSGSPSANTRFWLFVLTFWDYVVQKRLHGEEEFADRLAGLLRNALQSGRNAVLIAPDECILAVRKRMEGETRAMLLSYCSYARFLPLLMNAEYSFQWNAVSTSSHLRMLRGLPNFTFDQGHLARALPAWYPRLLKYYYNGWVPSYLDHDEPLDPEFLQIMAAGYEDASKRLRKHLARAPTPEELVRSLLE